jgi:hypothetical protein
MKNPLLILTAAIGLVVPLAAHHSFGAEYDADKPLTLAGVITKIEWTNPHTHLYLDITDASGKTANWKIEGYPPTVLYRTGFKREVTIKAGDKITIFAWHARDGSNWAHGRQITFSDGKKLYWGPPAGTGDGGARPAVDVP